MKDLRQVLLIFSLSVFFGFVLWAFYLTEPQNSFAQIYCETNWFNTSSCTNSCTLTQEEECTGDTRTVPCTGGDCSTPSGGCSIDADCIGYPIYLCNEDTGNCYKASTYCGDGTCDPGEGYTSCSVDCSRSESSVCGTVSCPDGSTGNQLCEPSCTEPSRYCWTDCAGSGTAQACSDTNPCTGPTNCGYGETCGTWSCSDGSCLTVNCQCAPEPTSVPTNTPTPTPTCGPPEAPNLYLSTSDGLSKMGVCDSFAGAAWPDPITCTTDATPTWSWDDVSIGGSCAVTETGLYTNPTDVWQRPWQSGIVTSYTTPILASHDQCYFVTAQFRNILGWGGWPTPVGIKTDYAPPSVPANVSISCTPWGAITVSWTGSVDSGCAGLDGTAAYSGQISRNADYSSSTSFSKAPGSNSYTYPDATGYPGASWYARVLSKDALGLESAYGEGSVICPNCSVDNLSCGDTTANSIAINYTVFDTGAGTGVNIMRNLSGDYPLEIASAGTSSSSYIDTGLATATLYDYQVRCYRTGVDGTNYFGHSETVTCSTDLAPATYSCTLSPQNQTIYEGETITLSQTKACESCPDINQTYFVWQNPPTGSWQLAPNTNQASAVWIAPGTAGSHTIGSKA